jgi:hypothetical protein
VCTYIYILNLVVLRIHFIQYYILVLNGNISGKERVAGDCINLFQNLAKCGILFSKLSMARGHTGYCGLASGPHLEK